MAMTPNHMGVHHSSTSVSSPSSVSPSSLSLSSNPVYRIIRDLPLDRRSVHDIHLRFTSPQIYGLASLSISHGTLDYDYTVNTRSQDILLRVWDINGLFIKVIIHRTDTVSVVIGCSINPITLDFNGLIRLTNALSIIEDRLYRVAEESCPLNSTFTGGIVKPSSDWSRHVCVIPPHSEWIVTMWHFGADAAIEYAGDKFSVTWDIAENVLVRAYSKSMNDNRTKIRLERQEYPKTTLADAIEQKINSVQKFGG